MGAAMGMKLAPPHANLCVGFFEETTISLEQINKTASSFAFWYKFTSCSKIFRLSMTLKLTVSLEWTDEIIWFFAF